MASSQAFTIRFTAWGVGVPFEGWVFLVQRHGHVRICEFNNSEPFACPLDKTPSCVREQEPLKDIATSGMKGCVGYSRGYIGVILG